MFTKCLPRQHSWLSYCRNCNECSRCTWMHCTRRNNIPLSISQFPHLWPVLGDWDPPHHQTGPKLVVWSWTHPRLSMPLPPSSSLPPPPQHRFHRFHKRHPIAQNWSQILTFSWRSLVGLLRLVVVVVVVVVFAIVFLGQVMSFHHSDQMCQRSQVPSIAP